MTTLKAKFIAGKIPGHLRDILKEGTLYSLIDQHDIVLIVVGEFIVPFRCEQVERRGEDKPLAVLQIRYEDEFLEELLKNFEMYDDDIDLI
jgi:hypothetical protein